MYQKNSACSLSPGLIDFVIIPLLTALWLSAPGLAQEKPTCLDQAIGKIKPEERITILTTDSLKFTGRLLAINLSASQATIHKLDTKSKATWAHLVSSSGDQLSLDTATFFGSDISQIKYYRSGRVRGGPVLVGMGVGALLVGIVATASFDPNAFIGPQNAGEALLFGAVVGSVLGLVVGTVVSLVTPSPRTIKCQEP
ncbi:MAG TPA: hypothetical protein VJ165_02130 [candidate division Zixibacteria bacterium]|nr:hypothetical protein [candidate division Zixibacteria bacterium]